jgi:hypothetical protein
MTESHFQIDSLDRAYISGQMSSAIYEKEVDLEKLIIAYAKGHVASAIYEKKIEALEHALLALQNEEAHCPIQDYISKEDKIKRCAERQLDKLERASIYGDISNTHYEREVEALDTWTLNQINEMNNIPTMG